MTLKQKAELREDLLSDMRSAAGMSETCQLILDTAEGRDLSASTIGGIERLLVFEQARMRDARAKMNKLRRGQL